MANTKITTNVIADDAITTAKIADDQITSALVADDIALGGNPTTTTQSAGNNTTRVATTAFVTTAIAAINTSSAADDISTGDAAVTIGTSSGNITLDSPASIKLNADGGQIAFEDGSTEIGVFENSSSDFQIESKVQDKDIKFVGNDNGSAVTALTLDMSEAGTATFNHDIKLGDNGQALFGAGDDLTIYHDASDSYIKDTGTGNLLIQYSDLYFSKDAGSTHSVVFRSTGNVGIGTSAPARTLHVNSSDANVASFEGHQGEGVVISSGTNGQIDIIGYDDGASSYNPLMIRAATNGLYLNTSGNVCIGTTTALSNATLTVDGGDMMVQGANNSAGISDLLPGYTRGDYGVFYSSANNIYFAVGSSYISYIAGGSGQYTVSDERMKENVTTLSGTLDKVKQLRGVSHTWKDTEQMGTDTQIGMIAQEVEKIYPELVGDGGLPNDNEGNAPMKSVNYPHLTSVLVEAIKELSTKLEAAEARIKTLEDA